MLTTVPNKRLLIMLEPVDTLDGQKPTAIDI